MKRDPAEITQDSAASIAKWRISELIEDDKFDGLTKFAMQQAIKDGGGVDEIAEILYTLGLKIAVDKNNPEHQDWIKKRAVVLEGNS